MRQRRKNLLALGAALALSAAPLVLDPGTGLGPSGVFAQSKTTSKPATSPKKRSTRKRRARGQQTPTTDRIREIQQALARGGHYQAEPTGKWDAATVTALKSFQQANDLTATGKLDARTLQKLGLGSEIAGSAPPRASNGQAAPPARP